MRHWWQLGIRNWRVKPGRTAGAIGAVALGVGVVIWVTCAHESVRLALRDQVWFWIGRSHLAVESIYGAEGTVYESIAGEVSKLPNVQHVSFRLKQRMVFEKLTTGSVQPEPQTEAQPTSVPATRNTKPKNWDDEEARQNEVQAVGIVPALEEAFRDYDQDRIVGRMLNDQDCDAAVIDEKLAAQADLKLGDRFTLRAAALNQGEVATETSATFTVVGLLHHRRIAQQQRPVVLVLLDRVQKLRGYDREPRRVTRIDMIVRDYSAAALVKTESEVTRIVNRHQQGFMVTTSKGKLAQVEAAENQTKFILLVLSTVALFTAFFIILSTLSMGMVERIGQLGTLRCLGTTRLQLAVLVLSEAVPMALLGIVLGIPVGLALGRLSVWLAPGLVSTFAISRPGLVLALGGGVVTTLAGALLPMAQAMRVSPLNAARPHARPAPGAFTWIAAVIGVAMICSHQWMVAHVPVVAWFRPERSVLGVSLLYAGYALIVPAVVRVVGVAAVALAAKVLRLRYQLLQDQVGRAVWRSGVICCGLMVGLSLIVTLAVHSESMAAGWDFPKHFCEAFVYVQPPTRRSVMNEARKIPGVGDSCMVNTSIRTTARGRGLFNFPFTLFVAADPDDFFRIARLEFVAGNREEAIERLKKGGGILVTPEFVRSKGVGYGDKVFVTQAARFGAGYNFEIVGVVTSPALHIAANYFNAGDMLVSQSVHVLLGTLNDARQRFRAADEVSLLLTNFDLPETEPPAAFAEAQPPRWPTPQDVVDSLEAWRAALPERAAEIDRLSVQLAADSDGRQAEALGKLFRAALIKDAAKQWSQRTAAQRWRMFREGLVMRLVAQRTGAASAQHASVRALKLQIDENLRDATRLLATIPMVALLVAALGVGNLMMANVTNRTREIAMLRAVGATRWQITRLVIGEAMVLGSIGGAVGVALGMHASNTLRVLILGVWGFKSVWTIPWGWVGLGLGFTLTVCLLAAVLPARRAARNNIVNALHTT